MSAAPTRSPAMRGGVRAGCPWGHVPKFTGRFAARPRARWRDEAIELSEGKPQARLSPLLPSAGYQLRESPVGFRSEFHCTGDPQWVFILGGQMEIGLQDGTSRVFGPGQHFYSADVLPAGASFDHLHKQLVAVDERGVQAERAVALAALAMVLGWFLVMALIVAVAAIVILIMSMVM